MINKKICFRHELKYLINEGDKELIGQRLKAVMDFDTNAVNGKYIIRSLYFDDYWGTAYNDKLSGISSRKKYRIRIYDYRSDLIRLECKMKEESYIFKTSALLNLKEYESIINGEYEFLLKREENICHEFYYECVSKVLRPRVIVDYEREPYVLKAGDVRVTFDKQVRSASPGFDIFSADVPTRYVLEPKKLIMEVKFTEFLPSIIKTIIPPRAAEMTAVSKYVLCCESEDIFTAKSNY